MITLALLTQLQPKKMSQTWTYNMETGFTEVEDDSLKILSTKWKTSFRQNKGQRNGNYLMLSTLLRHNLFDGTVAKFACSPHV